MSPMDWKSLPKELIELIFDKLKHAGDIIRFGVVCKFWGIVAWEARQQVFKPLRPLCPMLLLPPNTENDNDNEPHKLYDFSKKKFCKIQIPDRRDKWLKTSCNGWLITISYAYPYNICCLNPISGQQVHLPSAMAFDNTPPDLEDQPVELFLKKVVLSSSPSNPDCVVMVIYSLYSKLAFWKPGYEKWITLKSDDLHMDLLYYEGNFYALGRLKVLQCDINVDDPKVIPFVPLPLKGLLENRYLVDSSAGSLLYVLRYIDLKDDDGDDPIKLLCETRKTFRLYELDSVKWRRKARYETTKFVVFKLDFDKMKWKQVKSIGDNALFLGHNQAISISTQFFGQFTRNNIYFLDDNPEGYLDNVYGCHDMGIVNIKTQRFNSLFRTTQLWPSPLFWIRPKISSVC